MRRGDNLPSVPIASGETFAWDFLIAERIKREKQSLVNTGNYMLAILNL